MPPARDPLPVDALLPELVTTLREASSVVLHAPTGAGKTTRVPPALLDVVPGRIVMLEPRRLAARAAAARMAAERGERVGEAVGYQVRFDRKIGRATRIEVVTEGILLRRLQDDPFLTGVDAIVFDEFHERSLDQDLAFGWVRRLRHEVRPDLRTVVMSATLDLDAASDALGGAPVLRSEGRLHPVEIEYLPHADERHLEKVVRSTILDVLRRTDGDVLVFLPGMAAIRRAEGALDEDRAALEFDTVILHGDLAPGDQDRALRKGPRRRVVLATNVAETSVTVDGVTAVVDSGLARIATVDTAVGIPRLEVTRISRAAADQRAGRAGRLAPGLCVRLWTESRHRLLAERESPEVLRTDLAPALLTLLDWGETDAADFPWITPPTTDALDHARGDLIDLGATTDDGRLTGIGRELARLPVHPRLGRLLLAGRDLGVPDRAALAAALLAERDPFERGGRGPVDHATDSDVLDRVEALERFRERGTKGSPIGRVRPGAARRVLKAAGQLERLLGKQRSAKRAAAPDPALRRALLCAFADRLARRREPGSDRAVMRGGKGVRLDPRSGVRDAELFVCVEIEAGRRGERAEARVRQASTVDRTWLDEDGCTTADEVTFDTDAQRVRTYRVTAYHGLELRRVEVATERVAATARVLADAAAERLEAALGLDDSDLAEWLERVAFLRAHRPELGLPSFERADLAALLPDLCLGSVGLAELRKIDLKSRLAGHLDHAQATALRTQAPERIEVPSGSHVRLRYRGAEPPILAARIQELFGMHETPRVAGGSVPVLLHLLAPNQRPQQVTDDLASFWNTTYAVVRKDLRRRYPRHAWPEDPWTAQAERRPRRRRT